VLPVGGVKEKVLAAYRAGITTVLLPQRNLRDVDDLADEVRERVTLLGVETMDDVLGAALAPSILPAQPVQQPHMRRELVEPQPARRPAARRDPLAAVGRIARPRTGRDSSSIPLSTSDEFDTVSAPTPADSAAH
jgi:Lon protease (S16) C-terminal proteolytic domain